MVDSANLAYLQLELSRIDIMLRREVRRWVLAGQDPNDDYRGMYVTQAEVVQLLSLPPGTRWGNLAILPPEEEAAFDEALARVSQEAEKLAERATKNGEPLRLLHLAQAF